jgi:hypothetical protein
MGPGGVFTQPGATFRLMQRSIERGARQQRSPPSQKFKVLAAPGLPVLNRVNDQLQGLSYLLVRY